MTDSMLRPQTGSTIERGPDKRIRLPRYAYVLSIALGIMTAAAGATTFLNSHVLRGPPVMNGSARGTALVAVLIGVPVLAIGMWLTAAGSARGVFVWFGATLYLIYNAVLLLFFTPFNQAFLLYIAMMALAMATSIALLASVDARALRARCAATLPVRGIAIYVWAVVGLNLLAWLRQIVPAVVSGDPPKFLVGTGLSTSAVFVQDLAVWLPLLGVSALWLWRRRPWGYLLVGGGLTMWVLESITIATDQQFGHLADPTSSVASSRAVPAFAVAALISLVALGCFLRHVDRTNCPPTAPESC